MNKESIYQMLLHEISLIPGRKTIQRERAMIQCPFHNDDTPSGSINLDTMERHAPLGYFSCFGCKKKAKWNDLAQVFGLKTIGRPKTLTSEHFAAPDAYKEDLLADDVDHDEGETNDVKRFPDLADLEFEDEFPFDEWRDVPVSILKKVGAKFARHVEYETHYVWIPVMVQGRLEGYTNAKLQKPTNGKPSYLNAPGRWSNKYGLLYYDYAVKLMKKKGLRTIVLVEGQRDGLRLLLQGIPAMAVIGALNWSARKRSLLEDLGLERVIIAFDGDDAGLKATKVVYKDVRKFFDVKYLALWKYRTPVLDKKGRQKRKDNGKLLWENEMDPFNCPQVHVDAIIKALV